MTESHVTVIVLDDGSAEAATTMRRARGVDGIVVVSRPQGEVAPWSDVAGGPVVMLLPGDGLVADHVATRVRGVTPGSSTAGGYRPAAREWDDPTTPPARLVAGEVMIRCPVELATLTVARETLPDRPEVAPGLPGGTEWLVAHLLTTGSITTDSAPIALCSADLRARPEQEIAARASLAATRLAHDLGVASAIRQQLAALVWLDSRDVSASARWWEPVIARNDPDELDALVTDLTVSLDHLHARLVATIGGLDAVIVDQGPGDRTELGAVNPDTTIHRLNQVVERLQVEIEGMYTQVERADAEASRRLAEIERLQEIIEAQRGVAAHGGAER